MQRVSRVGFALILATISQAGCGEATTPTVTNAAPGTNEGRPIKGQKAPNGKKIMAPRSFMKQE